MIPLVTLGRKRFRCHTSPAAASPGVVCSVPTSCNGQQLPPNGRYVAMHHGTDVRREGLNNYANLFSFSLCLIYLPEFPNYFFSWSLTRKSPPIVRQSSDTNLKTTRKGVTLNPAEA